MSQTISNNLSVANAISSNSLTTSTANIQNLTVSNLSINNGLTTNSDINCNNINSSGSITATSLSVPNLNLTSLNLNGSDLNTRITNIESKNINQDSNISTNTTSISTINSTLPNKSNLNTDNTFIGTTNRFKNIQCDRLDALGSEVYSESQFTFNTNNFNVKNPSGGYYNVGNQISNLNTLQNNISGMGLYYDINPSFIIPSPVSSGNESGTFATFIITPNYSNLGSITFNFPIAIRYTNLVNLNFSTTNQLSNLVIKMYKNGTLQQTFNNPSSTTSYNTQFTVNNNGNNNINAQGEQYFGNITISFIPDIGSNTNTYTFKATPTFSYTLNQSYWAIQIVPNSTVQTTVNYNYTLNFQTSSPSDYASASYSQYPTSKTNNYLTVDYALLNNAKVNTLTSTYLNITNLSSNAPNDQINVSDVINFNDLSNFNGLLNIKKALSNSYMNVNNDTLTINSSNIYSVYYLKSSSTVTCTITLTNLGSSFDGLTITIRQLGGSGKSFRVNSSGVIIRRKDNSEGNIDEGNLNTCVLMFVNADNKWYELIRV